MIFYVDGACSGNGSTYATGGFGVVGLIDDLGVYYYSKGCQSTTNNREELKAIIYVLKKFGVKEKIFEQLPEEYYPIVYSDSAYSVNTLTDWIFRWERNNWLKADNKIPENLDLIQEYFELYQKGYRIDLRKIKGHSGNYWNEMADKLAKIAKEKQDVYELNMMTKGEMNGEYNSDSNSE